MRQLTNAEVDADLILEEAVLNGIAANELAVAAGLAPVPRSHDRASAIIEDAVGHCRYLGISDEVILYSLRLNLSTYGIAPDSCPIEEWTATEVAGTDA